MKRRIQYFLRMKNFMHIIFSSRKMKVPCSENRLDPFTVKGCTPTPLSHRACLFPSRPRNSTPTHLLTFDHCVSIPCKSGRAGTHLVRKKVGAPELISEADRPSQQGSPRSRHLPQSKRPLSHSLAAAYCVWVLITHTQHVRRIPQLSGPKQHRPNCLVRLHSMTLQVINVYSCCLALIPYLPPTHPPHILTDPPSPPSLSPSVK